MTRWHFFLNFVSKVTLANYLLHSIQILITKKIKRNEQNEYHTSCRQSGCRTH